MLSARQISKRQLVRDGILTYDPMDEMAACS